MTGFSILGLVDEPGRVVDGEIQYRGRDIANADEKVLQELRGNNIAMIFQDPIMALNPVLRIDTQMVEAVRAHREIGRGEARDMAAEALERVGIPAANERLKAYPH